MLEPGHKHFNELALMETVKELLSIGSSNAKWKNAIYFATSKDTLMQKGTIGITNIDGTDHNIYYNVPLETSRGSYKLYISEIEMGIRDADANDYISRIRLVGIDDNSNMTEVVDQDNGGSGWTTIDEHNLTFTAVDMSSYKGIVLRLGAVVTTKAELEIYYLRVKFYYA